MKHRSAITNKKQIEADPAVVACLRDEVRLAGNEPPAGNIENVALMEACGFIIDLENGDILVENYAWQPFVNFWMQSVAQRDGAKRAQADDFETWCNLAKYHQSVYFKKWL